MKVLIDIGHPAHVHFFKNLIKYLKDENHEVLITTSDKDVSCKLMDELKLKYINFGSYGNSLLSKIIQIPIMDCKMIKVALKFNPDLFLGLSSSRAAHVAYLLNKKCYIFDDTEERNNIFLYKYFADRIYTPLPFKINLGKKQIRYAGYHELAYLHPNRFKPNPKILDELNIKPNDIFFIVRFVGWKASHDFGQYGFSKSGKIKLVRELEKKGRVLITSEIGFEKELEKYRIDLPVSKIHDLLFYASMYVGEGATMASEAAMLGIPSVYVSSLSAGTLEEQSDKFKLIHIIRNEKDALVKVKEMLNEPNLKEIWQINREKMLQEKIDVTSKLVEIVEESKKSDKKNGFFALKNLLSLIATIGLIFFIARYVQLNLSKFHDVSNLSLKYLIIIFFLVFTNFLLTGFLLKKVMFEFGTKLKFKEWFGLTMVTALGNIVLPFGGLGFRAAYLKKIHNFDYTYLVSTTATILVIEFIVFTLGGVIGLIYLRYTLGYWILTLAYLFFIILAISAYFLIFSPHLPKYKNKWVEKFDNIFKSFYELKKNRRLMFNILMVSVGQFIIISLMFYFSFQAFNFHISIFSSFIPACISDYSMFIRILPASFGLYEGAIIYSAKIFNLTFAQGLLVAATIRLISIIQICSFGLFFFYILTNKNKEINNAS